MSNGHKVENSSQLSFGCCECFPDAVPDIMNIVECLSASLFHDLFTRHYCFRDGEVFPILLLGDYDGVSLFEFSLHSSNAWCHNVRTFRYVWNCTHVDYSFEEGDFKPFKGFEAWIESLTAPNKEGLSVDIVEFAVA